ncbi:MAG: histidinol dehydrogenase [Gemmatimonadaceae bacterium]
MSELVRFFYRGSLREMDTTTRGVLLARASGRATSVSERTAAIVADVRERGDNALREMALKFDGATIEHVEVPREQWTRALHNLPVPLKAALTRAARNIETVHRAFLPTALEVSPEPGITVGRRPDALERVGVYAPGGRASYPSSLLMGAIPARVAGVREVIVCSPPSTTGEVSPVVLAAAALANVDRVFAVGGAGAIAAMAIGTATIPRVDRIVGPGNAYVAEAKLQLVGAVAIDSPAGPSELLVLADNSASPEVIAREVAAQAEHDPDAAVIVVLVGHQDAPFQTDVFEALSRVVHDAPRAEVIRQSLQSRGALITTDSLEAGIQFANEWAAEHLLLALRSDRQDNALSKLRAAGTVFVGESSSVAFGDYMTGANHVLPTAGLARCYSGLSTLDFVRWTSWQRVTPEAAHRLSDDVATFADAEGLPAHATAARFWHSPVVSQSEEKV